MAFYSRQHYAAMTDKVDTPEVIAERIRYREICEQVRSELAQRYPVLTKDNAGEAIEWQTRRTAELVSAA